MNDILKTYKEQFRENRHTLRRYTAFVLALAMITTCSSTGSCTALASL